MPEEPERERFGAWPSICRWWWIEQKQWKQALGLHLPPQDLELPAHEGVIVGVHVGGDEGAPPVHAAAERLDVADGPRREVAQPVVRMPVSATQPMLNSWPKQELLLACKKPCTALLDTACWHSQSRQLPCPLA